ncbi:eukaryotic translation initiation factor 4E-binding protein 3-like isoform X2 [Xiphophorus couchianus]|uniref:eukaryotic translation initiation factor 4E-binding protein 3-like isoform X2 n=1 Tax=Xiphophorus couchianus TaxID=32473 RepID=UPI0010163176|nr:eukaryotic translation initiation factor 4E-binding protein 3-like isoform X2 [Xiphophorus couchianus]
MFSLSRADTSQNSSNSRITPAADRSQRHMVQVFKTGTRIIYDRKFLLDCRNSPLARTPPCCLPQIPGVTVPATHAHHTGKLQDLKEEAEEEEKDIGDDSQFEMDI